MTAATATRGTTNGNARGSSYTRAVRRAWLVETYRADVDMLRVVRHYVGGQVEGPFYVQHGGSYTVANYATEKLPPYGDDAERHLRTDADVVPACRCYRCGVLLTVDTVTVDRIIPGCEGGTYRRNNIRPACGTCNSSTGGALRGKAARR